MPITMKFLPACAALAALFSICVYADQTSSVAAQQKYTFTASELSGPKGFTNSSPILPAQSQQFQLSADDKAIVEKAKSLRQSGSDNDDIKSITDFTKTLGEDFHNNKVTTAHLNGARDIGAITTNQQGIKASNYAYRNLLFVSFSMSEKAIKQAFATVSTSPDTVIIFRGLENPKNVLQSVLKIHALSKENDPITPVLIDPVKFRDFNVSKVPTVIRLDDKRVKEETRITGVTDIPYFMDRVKNHQTGNLGNYGPQFDISELDLIEVMKDKASQIDWQKKQEEVAARFWTKQKFTSLTPATRTERRYFDPTVLTTNEIKDSEGKVLVPSGTSINPLSLRDFGQAMVIFDPRVKDQREYVDANLLRLQKMYGKVSLIATEIPRESGWDFYKNLTTQFKHHVYVLTPEIRSRFNINVTPSIVTSDPLRKVFVIDEIAIIK